MVDVKVIRKSDCQNNTKKRPFCFRWVCDGIAEEMKITVCFVFFGFVHFSKIENKSPSTGIKQLIKVTGDSFGVNKMNVYF